VTSQLLPNPGAVASKLIADTIRLWYEANAPWMQVAQEQLQAGVREVAGKGSNRQIKDYLESCWASPDTYRLGGDDTPWCSAFVNWCLLKSGVKGTGSTWSLSWRNWKGGQDLGTDPMTAPIGSIVVMTRGKAGSDQGHVAFLYSKEGGKPHYLGGNQGDGTLANRRSDRVSVCHYPNKVAKVIWPLKSVSAPQAWREGRIV
jgi:uncharacterized protein (TIGR02594 family)